MLNANTRMIITQALASVGSPAAIFFLLTSYLEAIQWHDGAAILPPGLLRLPLRGEVDVASRHAEAVALRGWWVRASAPSPAPVNELCEVLDAALQRLRALQTAVTQCGSAAGDWPHDHAPRRMSTC